MEEEVGMLGITPELEAQGRGADTEVGFIEVGSIVIPEPIATEPELSEMFDSLKSAIEMQGQNPEQFTVTPENTLYAYSQDNAIPAHLTNGEFVVPVQVLNVVPNLQEQLAELFALVEININQYTVGHPDNSINPNTGYPEFLWKKIKRGFKSLGRGLSGALKSIGSTLSGALKGLTTSIKRGIDGVVDFTSNFVKSLGQGAEDLFKGDLEAVLENPAVIATASFMFPAYGAYINLGSKAVTGQKITTADLVSAGFSASTDFTKVKIDPNAVKAVTTAAQIADGTDPVQALASNYGADWLDKTGIDGTDPIQALAGNYGADWLDETGIGDNIKSGVRSTIGDEYADRVFDNFDLNQAVADYSAGNSTERILANQFGDDVVGYLGAESPSERALGFAGIETAVQKAEGASDKEALYAGAKTYYNRGGQLPDAGQIASLAGIEDVDFDINELVGDLGIDFPTLQGQGYDIPSLADFGVNLPSLGGIETPELIANFQLPEVANLGFDIPSLDLSGYKPTDLGYDVGEFGQLRDLGVDIGSLDLGDYNLPELADLNLDLQLPELDLALQQLGQPASQVVSLGMDPDLTGDGIDFIIEEDSEVPLSRRLLATV